MNAHSAKLYSLTATQAVALFKSDSITVEEYARALLDRVRERDDIVKAWAYLNPELVLSQAQALDKVPRAQRGPLHGVAVAVKDIMETKGFRPERYLRHSYCLLAADMPTQYGSPLYSGNWPDIDSSPVSILRSAGALIFGKTTTPEFTVLNKGPNTTNPHDRRRTPGGSSTGSAAAVADFQVPLSLGSQNGGSIIRPASYTGLFAMKPTLNAVSAEGVKMVSFNIDTCGFFARSMADLQLVSDVFGIRSDIPPTTIPLNKLTVAFIKSPFWSSAGPGTIAAMEKAANILRGHGSTVIDVELPPELSDAAVLEATQKTVLHVEAQSAFLMEYRKDKSKLDQKIRDLVENKANHTLKETIEATERYAAMRTIFDKFAEGYSAIITPSAPDIAPLGIDDMGPSTFNFLWTGLHGPTVHIPAFVGAEGMPIGLSVVSSRFYDQHLLKVCEALSEPLMAEGGWDAQTVPGSKI
ncbi:hypothetical protein LTR97_004495 [Elasticomyces elasticus]|uniref:Amidase domain-containing protein n=1 Tax=Elasticomyces elasticus TaxID=574655 RepID=A0AAN7WBZ6_9PEZI|nr:hypothetical protein LTR97_004495 [Elasticomyces elasticus]